MSEQSTDGEAVVEAAETDPAPAVAETVPVVDAPTEDVDPREATDSAEIIDLDAAPEPETAEEPEAVEASEDAVEGDDEPAEEGEADEGEEAVEMVEINFGGNKLEVERGSLTPELEAKVQEFASNTWADYTKGKQEVAETAKTLSSEREAVAKLTTLNGEALQTYSHGLQLRSEIEQLSAIDLTAEWQSNPDRARRISDTLADKQAQFQATIAKVGEQETALDAAQQENLVRRSEAGKTMLDSRIKNFSTEKVADVIKYVTERGMPEAEAQKWALNPEVTEYAYKAMQFDRMQAKAKKPKAKPAQAKPVTALNGAGASASSNDPEKMDMRNLAKHLGIAS